MTEPDPLVSRIDALVKHRRSFVARAAGPAAGGAGDEAAPVTDAAPERATGAPDEDVPLLTEVIDLGEASSPDDAAPIPLEPLIQALAADLAHALEYRLQTDLPAVIDTALERLSTDLRSGVAQVAESAIRDFLGRQQQLRLPLGDRNGD